MCKDKELCLKQFEKATFIAGDIAAKYNIMIVIEPLESSKTNIINSVNLKHFHIANPDGGLYPKKEDLYDYTKELKEIGYDGNMSIEGKTTDFESDLPENIVFLTSIFA